MKKVSDFVKKKKKYFPDAPPSPLPVASSPSLHVAKDKISITDPRVFSLQQSLTKCKTRTLRSNLKGFFPPKLCVRHFILVKVKITKECTSFSKNLSNKKRMMMKVLDPCFSLLSLFPSFVFSFGLYLSLSLAI